MALKIICIVERLIGVFRFLPVMFLLLGVWLGGWTAVAQPAPPPEQSTEKSFKALARAKSYMVSAAHPLAVEAGLEILRAGGNAIDAAVAVQLVLGLVEPQSSGLGGGAFVMHWDQSGKTVRSYDGRETAPLAAKPDRFYRDGKLIPFDTVVHSGLSIGVPGTPRLLEFVHRRHGRLAWRQLFEPALRLAEDGFKVTLRLNVLLRLQGPEAFDERGRRYFFDAAGSARPVGYLLKNPEYARTLRALADGGAQAFYSGGIAREIVAAVGNAPNFKGNMTLGDIAGYQVFERDPVCFRYRGRRLCGMGPPSSGGLTTAMTLKLLEPFDLGRGPGQAMRAAAMHLIVEAEKVAYADRDRYMADPAFVSVPRGLVDDRYLAERRLLINPVKAMPRARAGLPPGVVQEAFGRDATIEASGTTHFSIVDGDGNAVAMTSTIETGFGSGVWAAGFLLNNELTDFSFRAKDRAGRPIANAVGPGKRPRSSMSPTLVFGADGQFEAALGSVGGSAIITYVVKALIALIDWQMDAQAACDLINFGSRGRGLEIEYATDTVWHALKLKPYGHKFRFRWPISGTHIVVRRQGWLEGGADPRREGIAKGD